MKPKTYNTAHNISVVQGSPVKTVLYTLQIVVATRTVHYFPLFCRGVRKLPLAIFCLASDSSSNSFSWIIGHKAKQSVLPYFCGFSATAEFYSFCRYFGYFSKFIGFKLLFESESIWKLKQQLRFLLLFIFLLPPMLLRSAIPTPTLP